MATEMGRTLPGSPIVGLFNEQDKDFGGHDKQIAIKGGKFEMVDLTRPYGFVPTNAKVWFQKFNDEGIEHEYLCTECYIWTGAYPESQRIVEKGNNQSMELDNDTGFWTNDFNSGKRVFIYNEALIKKLCVLGENVEPCFEGAQFSEFSLNGSEFEEFKTKMYSMIQQIQESLNKGGSQMENENKTPQAEFEKKNPNNKEEEKKNQTPPTDDSKKEDSKPAADGNKKPEDEDKEKNKKKYNLDEITEYVELKGQYATLQSQYAALQAEKNKLDAEVVELRQFRLTADRQAKQNMINSFYMLSDEDKKDVKDHIDTYSLDDIEAKLSIICVRNKVNFNLEQETPKQKEEAPQGLFNLNSALSGADDAPDWIKAVRATVNK